MAGYATITMPDAPMLECDTRTCGHCQRIVFVKPGTASTVYLVSHRDGSVTEEMGACCRVCMSAICLSCLDVGTCTPWERRMEQSESRDRLRRQID